MGALGAHFLILKGEFPMASDRSANIRRIVNRRCAALGIPSTGSFELTPRCNLRCKMCYVRLTPAQMAPLGRELTAKEWIDLGRAARDMGMMFLLLTGGEPTLRTDFAEIYEGLMKLGLSISVNTNGTLITPEIRELWHRLPPAMVNVTLYGTCREDYENLCGDPNAFDRVVEGLHWLKSEGILVHLNTTIAPDNLHHWMQMEEFAKGMGLELRMTVYCFPPVRRSECGSCADFQRLTPEESARLSVNDMLYREGLEYVKFRAANLTSPPQEECEWEMGEFISCLAGRAQFWLGWNGRMTPCGMLPEPATYPVKEGFASAWKALHEMTTQIRLCPDCTTCAEKQTCMNCAAVVYTETGSFDGKPEYMCRLNREYRRYLKEVAEKS